MPTLSGRDHIGLVRGGVWGANGIDGGQGEAVRVPLADSTLVKVPGSGHSDETFASLLTLSDVIEDRIQSLGRTVWSARMS